MYGEIKLVELLQQLSQIEELKWIRLLYCYPELIDDKLIDEIANNPKIVKYMDIPLQHSEDKILKLMGRRSTRKQVETLFDKLRNKIEDIAIRTTFILGFPNEDETDFEGLKDFVSNQKMSNVGFFAYSQEEGTAAARMKGQIENQVKQARLEELAEIQYDVVQENNLKQINNIMTVIVEDILSNDAENWVYVCRSQYNAPDIDGCVFVESKEEIKIGEFIDVKITGFNGYDLKGERV